MCRLLVVNTSSTKGPHVGGRLRGVPDIESGDVLGAYLDIHVFSPREQKVFDIVDVPGISVAAYHRLLAEEARPQLEMREASAQPGLDETLIQQHTDGKWYEMSVEGPKYNNSLRNLTVAEKDLLSTTDADLAATMTGKPAGQTTKAEKTAARQTREAVIRKMHNKEREASLGPDRTAEKEIEDARVGETR